MGMNWGTFLKDMGKSSWHSVSQGAVTGFATGILNAFGSRNNDLLPLDDMLLTNNQELVDKDKEAQQASTNKKTYNFSNSNNFVKSQEIESYTSKTDGLNNTIRNIDIEDTTTANSNNQNSKNKGRFNLQLYSAISKANEEDQWHIDLGNNELLKKTSDNSQNNDGTTQPNQSSPSATALHINLPVWGYDDFINERNMWTKSLQSPYSEPGYFYFKIFFDFNTLDGLLGGILNVNNTTLGRNSAAKYFDYCIESARYGTDLIQSKKAALIKFVKILSYINVNAPWFFQNISGLAEANSLVFNEINKQRKIEIGCLQDAIDMRLSTLLDLYKYAAFDDVKNREVIPENLRKFDINVLIYNIPVKRLHTPFKSASDEQNNRRTYGYKRASYINQDPNNVSKTSTSEGDLFDHVMSFKLFSFQNCEIDISSLGSAYSREFSNKEPSQIDGIKLSINYDKCLTYTSNEFNQILFGSTGFLYNVYSDLNVNSSTSNNIHKLSQRLRDLAEMQTKMNKTFRLDPTKDTNNFIEAAELIAHNNLFELSGMGFGNIYREDTKIGSNYYKNKLKYYNISSTFAKYFNSNNKSWYDKWFKKWHMDDNISDYAKNYGLSSGLSLVSQYISGAANINKTDEEQKSDIKAYMNGNKKVSDQYMTTTDKEGKTVDPRIRTNYNSNRTNTHRASNISKYFQNKQNYLLNKDGQNIANKKFIGIEKSDGTIIDPRANTTWEDKNNNQRRDYGEFSGASSYLINKLKYLFNKSHEKRLNKEFIGIEKDNGSIIDPRANSTWEDKNNNQTRDYGEVTGVSNYWASKASKIAKGNKEAFKQQYLASADSNGNKEAFKQQYFTSVDSNGNTIDPRINRQWNDVNNNGVREINEISTSEYWSSKANKIAKGNKEAFKQQYLTSVDSNGKTIDPRINRQWNDANNNGVREINEISTSEYWSSKANKIAKGNKEAFKQQYLTSVDSNGNLIDRRINSQWNDVNNNGIREINEISTSEYWKAKASKIWNRDKKGVQTTEHVSMLGYLDGNDITFTNNDLGKLWEEIKKEKTNFDKKSMADESLSKIEYTYNKLGSISDDTSNKKQTKNNKSKSSIKKSIFISNKSVIDKWKKRLRVLWKNTNNNQYETPDKKQLVINNQNANKLSSNLDKEKLFINDNSIINYAAQLGSLWQKLEKEHKPLDKEYLTTKDKYGNTVDPRINSIWEDANENGIRDYGEMSSISDYWVSKLSNIWNRNSNSEESSMQTTLTNYKKINSYSIFNDANADGNKDAGELEFETSESWNEKLKRIFNINSKG